jgi:hypothetical protein
MSFNSCKRGTRLCIEALGREVRRGRARRLSCKQQITQRKPSTTLRGLVYLLTRLKLRNKHPAVIRRVFDFVKRLVGEDFDEGGLEERLYNQQRSQQKPYESLRGLL